MASIEEWRLLLRRSFDIPDVIGDKTATATLVKYALGDLLVEDGERLKWSGRKARETLEEMIRVIAARGEEGKLDAIIVDTTDDTLLKEKAQEIDSTVLADPNRVTKLENACGRAKPLLISLKAFVLAHPFTDPLGPRQFGEPSADLAQ
jgi:hypothetical protein